MSDQLNFQLPINGFGSYLNNILPADIAVLAGAFSTSMQQVNNISNANLQRLAQVVFSCETTQNLPLITGTDVPTDVLNAAVALGLISLGSGPYGTYTMSNFFGAMSGLPYPLAQIQEGIQLLQTDKLVNIYTQLYLSVNWTQATATATITSSGGNYSLTDLTFTNVGGGYGRGSAVAPTVTITGANGFVATATLTIGTDPTDLSTYGTVTGYTITSSGSQALDPTPVVVHIQAPPTATLPVNGDGSINTGGTNTAYGTAGWPATMDAVTQAYIDQANTEIIAISTSSNDNFILSNNVNALYDYIGTSLKIEQRTRYNALPPVPIPYSNYTSSYPGAIYTFTNFLSVFANDTAPNMSAQTLENISDLDFTGGQSIIGAMRENRNTNRLALAGINNSNNIPNGLTDQQQAQYYVNGTLPEAGVNYAPNSNGPAKPVAVAQINTNVLTAMNGLVIPNTDIPYPLINNGPNGYAAAQLVPMIINAAYTSGTLAPASYSPVDAIKHVVTCNCTCWLA